MCWQLYCTHIFRYTKASKGHTHLYSNCIIIIIAIIKQKMATTYRSERIKKTQLEVIQKSPH